MIFQSLSRSILIKENIEFASNFIYLHENA